MRSNGRNSGSGSGNRSGGGGGRGAAGGKPQSRAGGGRGGNGGSAGGRGSAGSRGSGAGGARDDKQPKRESKPRPEERRYDVGRSGGPGGGQGGSGGPAGGGSRGASARGGAKGGPKAPSAAAQRRIQGKPARPRELDAKIEQRNRDRYADKPEIRTPRTNPGAEQEGERLQKILARAGMGSRRACEELIEQARVEVNGEIVMEQGMRVDPHRDEIKVDGLTVATQSHLFFALNKPAGVVSTMGDPDGRQNLGDYVTNRETRLFHVGRLDTETEGIILLTNHGELAHRLTHPGTA